MVEYPSNRMKKKVWIKVWFSVCLYFHIVASSPHYILQIDLEFSHVRLLGEMKTAVVGERPATKYITSKSVEELKREEKIALTQITAHFFSESSQTEWRGPFNFPTGVKCSHGNEPITKFNSYLVRRIQDSNPGHIDSNARHKYWLFFLYHTLLSMYHFLLLQ